MEFESSNAREAVSNETPCFARLALFLFSSHSESHKISIRNVRNKGQVLFDSAKPSEPSEPNL
jgi:hypothetical protein